MAQTRMKNGVYKKILVRIPPDILDALTEETASSDRSLNGELVHVLREWVEHKRAADPLPRLPLRPSRATRASV